MPDACPTCDSPVEPGQEYCLECGARIPEHRGPLATVGHAWRRRLRWYPGDWLPVVLALLVVAALATAAAVYASRGDSETAAGRTIVATRPPDVTETAQPSATSEPEPVPSVPTEATATKPPVDGGGPGSLVEWPADQDGYTVVLASLPVSGGRDVAVSQARSAIRQGLEDVGVLDSDAYASLHPGYYVVFAGIYSGYEEAQGAIADARGVGFANAYAREVTP